MAGVRLTEMFYLLNLTSILRSPVSTQCTRHDASVGSIDNVFEIKLIIIRFINIEICISIQISEFQYEISQIKLNKDICILNTNISN